MACSSKTNRRNLIIFGKTGSGKSSTGNTILGRMEFDVSSDFASATADCCVKNGNVGGYEIKVMDTPGLFDTEKSPQEIGVILVKAAINLHPGFHALLYVIRWGVRYTKEEYAAYQQFKTLFGSEVTGHTIIVFTGGDNLQSGENVDEKLKQFAPKELKDVLDDCNWRYVVVNNKAAPGNQKQELELLQKVGELQHLNDGRLYVCRGYSGLGDTIEEQVGKRMRELDEQEAKANVYMQEMMQKVTEELEAMDLSKKKYEEQLAANEKKFEKEKAKMMKEWEKKREKDRQEQERRIQNMERPMQRTEKMELAKEVLGAVGTVALMVTQIVCAIKK